MWRHVPCKPFGSILPRRRRKAFGVKGKGWFWTRVSLRGVRLFQAPFGHVSEFKIRVSNQACFELSFHLKTIRLHYDHRCATSRSAKDNACRKVWNPLTIGQALPIRAGGPEWGDFAAHCFARARLSERLTAQYARRGPDENTTLDNDINHDNNNNGGIKTARARRT